MGHTALQLLAREGIQFQASFLANIHLADAFDRWYWGRFISADRRSALIFGDVIGKGNPPARVRPLLLAVDGNIQPRQAFEIEYGETTPDKVTGIRYPQEIRISNREGDLPFNFTLTPEETLEALHFASPRFRQPKIRSASEMLFYLTFSKPLIGGISRRVIGSTAYLRFQGRGDLQIEHPRPSHNTGEAMYEIMDFAP
jgi:hypothetical protein